MVVIIIKMVYCVCVGVSSEGYRVRGWSKGLGVRGWSKGLCVRGAPISEFITHSLIYNPFLNTYIHTQQAPIPGFHSKGLGVRVSGIYEVKDTQ